MKKILLTLVGIVCSLGMWAETETVAFKFKTDKDITYTKTGTVSSGGDYEISKGDVTLSGKTGYVDSKKNLIVYKEKGTLVIEVPGKISQVEFHYNGKVYPFAEAMGDDEKESNKFTKSGLHKAVYTVATPSNSVTFTNPYGGKTEVDSLRIIYTPEAVVHVTGITLSQTSATITSGDNITLTATVAPENATKKGYTWSSSDDETALVKDGKVFALKPGTATITATTVDGAKTATCDITINAKETPIYSVFFESFDQLLGNGGNDGVWSNITTTTKVGTFDNDGWATEGTLNSGMQCLSIRKVTEDGKDLDVISGLTTPAIGAEGIGVLTFKAESWGSDGSNFFVDIVDGGTFVESADVVNLDNESTTAKVALQKKGAWKTYTLKFKDLTTSSKFRFYAPAKKRAFLDEINVSILPIETIETNEVGVASYVTKNALDFSGVEGLTAYVATAATNSTVTLAKVTEVPANTAIVVKGDADTSYAVPGTVTGKATAPSTNLLKPGLWGVTDDDNIYALNSNGCFQKVAGGVTVPTGKAYIDLGSKAAKSVLSLNFGDATAINAIQTVNTANANAFNIAGQRVNGDAKGIVIVNGKKYINK